MARRAGAWRERRWRWAARVRRLAKKMLGGEARRGALRPLRCERRVLLLRHRLTSGPGSGSTRGVLVTSVNPFEGGECVITRAGWFEFWPVWAVFSLGRF